MEEGLSCFGTILRVEVIHNSEYEEDEYVNAASKAMSGRVTYVFDFFYGKVGICGDADCMRSDVNDDHNWPCNVSFEQVVNLQI